MSDTPKIVNLNDLEWKDATYSEHYTGWSKRLTPSLDRKQGYIGVVVERLKPKSLLPLANCRLQKLRFRLALPRLSPSAESSGS
jgi:hypothetical protein